jgi:hypothetical protein
MDRKLLLIRLACVALALCLVVPLGRLLFPAVADAIGAMPFNALEAVVTTTLGFGLYAALFG